MSSRFLASCGFALVFDDPDEDPEQDEEVEDRAVQLGDVLVVEQALEGERFAVTAAVGVGRRGRFVGGLFAVLGARERGRREGREGQREEERGRGALHH